MLNRISSCVVLVVCLITGEIEAAIGTLGQESWYIRSNTECAFNGDGLSYDCATEVGGSGAFVSKVPSNLIWTSVIGIDDGDILYICGTQNNPIVVPSNISGTLLSPITIRFDCPFNYGKIVATKNMTEALISTSWVNESAGVWYLSTTNYTWRDPKRLWVNGVEQFPSNTKANLGVALGGGPVGKFYYDSGTSRMYYSSITNPSIGLVSMVSLVANGGVCEYTALCINSPTNQHINIVDPKLEGGYFGSLYLLGASDIKVYGTELLDTNCVIGAKSSRGVLISDTSTAGTGVKAQRILIDKCIVDPIIPVEFTKYTWQWNGGNGDGIALVYGVDNAVVQNSIVRDWQHAMINMAATLGTGQVINNIIEQNQLTCSDHIEYCRAFAIDGGGINRATGNVVRRNLIDGMTIRSQYNGNGNTVTKNLFKHQRSGTVKPEATQSIDMEGYAGPSQDNELSKNVFVDNPYGPCISFRSGANTKSGFIVSDNVLLGCGGSNVVGYENTAIVVQDAPTVGSQTWLRNIIYNVNNIDSVFYKTLGKVSVGAFQAGCIGDVCTENKSFDAVGWGFSDIGLDYKYLCNIGIDWALYDLEESRQYFCVHP